MIKSTRVYKLTCNDPQTARTPFVLTGTMGMLIRLGGELLTETLAKLVCAFVSGLTCIALLS